MAGESNQKQSTANAAPAMKHETLIRQNLAIPASKVATSGNSASTSRISSIDDN
jgi:hypothetical protein